MNMPIFVVDDNEHLCECITFILSEMGYQVHGFECPRNALDYIKSHKIRPQILITDYNLPGMNGIELHEAMSQLMPELKTIVISGRHVDDRIGKLPFLKKPFPPEQLIELVETLKAADRLDGSLNKPRQLTRP